MLSLKALCMDQFFVWTCLDQSFPGKLAFVPVLYVALSSLAQSISLQAERTQRPTGSFIKSPSFFSAIWTLHFTAWAKVSYSELWQFSWVTWTEDFTKTGWSKNCHLLSPKDSLCSLLCENLKLPHWNTVNCFISIECDSTLLSEFPCFVENMNCSTGPLRDSIHQGKNFEKDSEIQSPIDKVIASCGLLQLAPLLLQSYSDT